MLDRVSLQVDAGETVALIGPSGGGKSTLLRCINGLNTFDQARSGRRAHDCATGRHARRMARRAARSFGMIFQDFQLFPHMTALRQRDGSAGPGPATVDEPPPDERAVQLLERVGLGDTRDAYPRQLSGGQKQRVAIARRWPWSRAACCATRSPAPSIPS